MVNTGRDDALGRLFKRCTKCGGKIADRRCAKCQSDSFSWAYVVDVARAGEKREQRTKAGFKTKADAVEALAELQTSKAAGTYVEANKATLGEFLDSWVKGLDARPWTRRGYESVIRRHIKPHLGSRPLQSVGKVEIRALYTELRLTGNVRGKKAGGSLSEKSVHNVHICLRAALNTAVENGLLRSNPAARALERPRAQAEIQTWTADELNTFLAFCREDRHFPLYRLAAFSGMRRGELLGLRWSDMKWNLSSLSVQRQLGLDTDNDGTKDLVAPKTSHGRRSISLDGETVAILQDWQARQEFERRSWALDITRSTWCSAGRTDRRGTPTRLPTSSLPRRSAPAPGASASTTYATPTQPSSWSRAPISAS